MRRFRLVRMLREPLRDKKIHPMSDWGSSGRRFKSCPRYLCPRYLSPLPVSPTLSAQPCQPDRVSPPCQPDRENCA